MDVGCAGDLPLELWWSIVGDVVSTSPRDRVAVSLACRLFRAIVTEWGDRAWTEYARHRGLRLLTARDETAGGALRARVEFAQGQATVATAADVDKLLLVDTFKSLAKIAVDRSALSHGTHDLEAFVNHLWSAASPTGYPSLVLRIDTNRDNQAWHAAQAVGDARRALGSYRGPLAVADGGVSYDQVMLFNGRHYGVVYFFEPGARPPIVDANVDATIVDGFGRDAGDVSRAIRAAMRWTTLAPSLVDAFARLCCGKRAFVLVHPRAHYSGDRVVSLSAVYYGAIHRDDHILTRSGHL